MYKLMQAVRPISKKAHLFIMNEDNKIICMQKEEYNTIKEAAKAFMPTINEYKNKGLL